VALSRYRDEGGAKNIAELTANRRKSAAID